MSAGFRVDPEAMESHARTVDALAARVRRAATAGRPLDIAAYGIVGQLFAVVAAAATSSSSAAVARAADGVGSHAEQVRAAAQDYRRNDRAAAGGFVGPR
jgi:uncharacterized protein YukE